MLTIVFLAVLVSIASPLSTVLADEDANQRFNEEVDEYIGDAEEFTDVIQKLSNDSDENKNPNKNSITHVMKRLLNVGEYVNDVEYGVLDGSLGVSKDDILFNDRYACNPESPVNLINHNCNIPNFTTGLFQNLAAPFSEPFMNAEKTSSYATFGFGVPRNIPGGEVPVSPGNRANTYTALELFGYDLKVSSYSGEWDKIDVSTQARMLSNFGVIDRVTLMGTGLWNSVRAGVGGLIENFSFNPVRWIGNTIDTSISGGLNTVIDTSDLNIVASNGWKRNEFNSTLYNVYVMTDREILRETSSLYFREFIDYLQANAELSPELSAVLELEEVPGFTFRPNWEKPESIQARRQAEENNRREMMVLEYQPSYIPKIIPIPEPVYYTEKEQLVFWEEDNQGIINKARNQGVLESNIENYDNYQEIRNEWANNWGDYFSREFNAMGEVVEDLLETSDAQVFQNNPHLDPKQPISQYACANPDGSIMRDNNGRIEYLYLANNKGNQEFLNPNCAPARAPISAGLFGSGWEDNVPPRPQDTRHIDNVNQSDFISSRIEQFGNGFMSTFRSINSFIARFTNTVLGLAFSPIMSELGIDVIVAELVEGFKNTIFFPMAALVATIGAFMLFMQLLKGQSAWQLLVSAAITMLVFVAGAAFLMYPDSTIKLVDEVPTRIDNFIANAVLVDDDGTSYCSTGDDADGIRSAQCNVWGIMVFNPWTHMQFGTGYDNLYASGHAPAGGSSFRNTNQELVGDAAVYMGGGQTVNNWAMYQLDKTKAGTINVKADRNDSGIGTVDKDMYRLVDLQAGPNNGRGTDSTYFDTWSGGSSGGGFVGLMTTIQNVVLAIAIIGLSLAKIEVSFMFSLSVLFLPFMLLYALMPPGRIKLKEYISTLGGLLLKRVVITVMLSVLLKTVSIAYSRVYSITTASTIAISIGIAFIMYRKEILNMITASAGAGSEFKELAAQNVPKGLQQRYAMTKAKIKGSAYGFVGGAAGATGYKVKADHTQRKNNRKIKRIDNKFRNNEKITEEQKELREQLIDENIAITKTRVKKDGIITQGFYGARGSTDVIGRRVERSLRRDGFAGSRVYKDAKDRVITEGANTITNHEDVELETYKEILSHSEHKISKTAKNELSVADARTLKDPKVQREIRKLADKRRKHMEENKGNKDYTAKSPDIKEMEELAKMIDKKRKANTVKGYMRSPYLEKEIQEESKKREQNEKITSSSKRIKEDIKGGERKAEIEREKELEVNLPKVEELEKLNEQYKKQMEDKAKSEAEKIKNEKAGEERDDYENDET